MIGGSIPVIGIASRAIRVAGRSRPFLGAFESYIEAVRACPAEPVILPMGAEPSAVEICDGVVLAGGEDVAAPQCWSDTGAEGTTDSMRDSFETALALNCRQRRVPLLAICRGAQLVNCILGGTLTRKPPDLDGFHGATREVSHEVRIEAGTLMSSAFGGAVTANVMSRHSAFIAELGSGLEPVAWAPDGRIEGFEEPTWPCLGVLWHAEWGGPDKAADPALFRWLANEARSNGQ